MRIIQKITCSKRISCPKVGMKIAISYYEENFFWETKVLSQKVNLNFLMYFI